MVAQKCSPWRRSVDIEERSISLYPEPAAVVGDRGGFVVVRQGEDELTIPPQCVERLCERIIERAKHMMEIGV